MQARMQVVGTVFNRFPRVVRDLSAQLGKQCELKIEGAEVELDKSIIEAIGDPLTHLVRNAVDHGVESPQQRQAAGKPAKATVVLRAFHQAGKVNISISDDGGGIDVARLKQKAVARGLLSPDQARTMNEREALGLIFRPGFSTAEKVTDVSGRGVGMDVVKTNIERVGGSVAVETEIGAGTTVHVKLPLTLAIIPCLIVHSAGNRYAIPQSSICELVRVKRKRSGDQDPADEERGSLAAPRNAAAPGATAGRPGVRSGRSGRSRKRPPRTSWSSKPDTCGSGWSSTACTIPRRSSSSRWAATCAIAPAWPGQRSSATARRP